MTTVHERPAVPHADVHGPTGRTAQPSLRRRLVRLFLLVDAVLAALVLIMFVTVYVIQNRLDGQLERIDGVFDDLPDRPAKPASGPGADALNVLLLGTDRRSDVPTTGTGATAAEWVPGAQRADTIMVLHVSAGGRGASVISIPRDSWVEVPEYGENKINAAFSYGGPSLAVRAVEHLTGLRIDHLAVVDWSGFRGMIDAVGGVTVTVPQTVEAPNSGYVWTEGSHHLDGEEALRYVRQRYGLPLGDLDRVRRQQAVLRALLGESVATVRSVEPLALYALLDTATRHISVDAEWSAGEMRDLLLDLRNLSKDRMHFLTAPVSGFGREGEQSVVYLDQDANRSLWHDVREDRVTEWLAEHPASEVTGPVR